VIASAASTVPVVAPDSVAAIFGPNLASRTATGAPPYPATLGGVQVQIIDSAGASRTGRLLYVSPGQINFVAPAGMGAGTASLNIIDDAGHILNGVVLVQKVAPALFTANANGEGVVAATAYRTRIPTSITGPVTVFRCDQGPGSCVSVPIDPGVDSPVTINLYATGIRGRSGNGAVVLTVGGIQLPVASITALDDASALAGVDQVTFGLPLTLRGAGEVDVVLNVDGIRSNAGRLNIQ
jgi:uncharacterized protein (TIGR03437 family)